MKLKNFLKAWNRITFGNITKRKMELLNKLQELEGRGFGRSFRAT